MLRRSRSGWSRTGWPSWMALACTVAALLAMAGCQLGFPEELPAESSGTMELNRDIYVEDTNGYRTQVTDMVGAEDCEAISPNGEWMAFVGGETGIASVYVARIPRYHHDPVNEPIQLTNVGLESIQREPGRPPAGWVRAPSRGNLTWIDDTTIAWEGQDGRHQVDLRAQGVMR